MARHLPYYLQLIAELLAQERASASEDNVGDGGGKYEETMFRSIGVSRGPHWG